jgi:hypothetical protein
MTELRTMGRPDSAAADAANYREMAASCRRMAAATRRPETLLLRAEHYERVAADLDQRAVIKHA